MALESILQWTYTHQSDVWSYGASTRLRIELLRLNGSVDGSFVKQRVFFCGSRVRRCDGVGADDVRLQTVRRDPGQRDRLGAGAGGPAASAPHLHHRHLHDHGEMYEEPEEPPRETVPTC